MQWPKQAKCQGKAAMRIAILSPWRLGHEFVGSFIFVGVGIQSKTCLTISHSKFLTLSYTFL